MTSGEDEIDVIVPTYRRPESLDRCLRAIAAQSVSPRRTLVVVREDDDDSKAVAQRWGHEPVVVDQPGLLAAMRAGAAASSSALIAFTDDDAEPSETWVQGLQHWFANDATVGAVGGRDVLPFAHGSVASSEVGRRTWFGRAVGNHHAGVGDAVDVDYLKGVNMAYRASVLAFPDPDLLRGRGAQPHIEPTMAWAVRSNGSRIVYDPQLLVLHHPAERVDGDHRTERDPQDCRTAAFNYVIAHGIGGLRQALSVWVYALLLGSPAQPGLARLRPSVNSARQIGGAIAGATAAFWMLLSDGAAGRLQSCTDLRAGSPRGAFATRPGGRS